MCQLLGMNANTPTDRVVVVATEPLTAGERWLQLAPGELRVFRHGAPLVPSAH
ncbi:MAG: class II glutamine amidotransferase [Rubrivivax sp.]|nr:class II glutamine amidotransferase [Rubrivivax sp.]